MILPELTLASASLKQNHRTQSKHSTVQEYNQYLLLTAIALETIGGVLFLLNFKSGATLLVRVLPMCIAFKLFVSDNAS